MGGIHSASATTAASHDDALPSEVVQCIASFLLGVDVIQYAHASPALYAALNSPEVWTHRIDPQLLLQASDQAHIQTPPWCCAAKAIYLKQRALQFRGTQPPTSWFLLARTPSCGDFVPLPHMLISRMWTFTLGLTFSVPPSTPGASTCHGGVLVGFQDILCTESSSSLQRADSLALVTIDTDAELYVSTDPRAYQYFPRAVAQLTFDRWYHLLVVVDRRQAHAYLDGKLCFSERITRSFRRLVPQYGQIGTGFRHKSFAQKPTAWQPFRGLLSEAHLMDAVLSADHVSRRARGEQCVAPGKFDDLLDGDAAQHATRVVTSRPCERYAQVLLRGR